MDVPGHYGESRRLYMRKLWRHFRRHDVQRLDIIRRFISLAARSHPKIRYAWVVITDNSESMLRHHLINHRNDSRLPLHFSSYKFLEKLVQDLVPKRQVRDGIVETFWRPWIKIRSADLREAIHRTCETLG